MGLQNLRKLCVGKLWRCVTWFDRNKVPNDWTKFAWRPHGDFLKWTPQSSRRTSKRHVGSPISEKNHKSASVKNSTNYPRSRRSSSVEFRWGNGFDFTSVPSKSRSTKGHIQCSFCGFWEEASHLDVFAYDSDIFRFNPFLALTWCFSGCSREASFVDTENWAATATGANPSSGRRKGGAALQVLVRNGGYHWSGVQQCNNGLCNRNLNIRSVKFAVTFVVVVAIVSIEGTFTDSRTSDRPFPSACPTSLRLSPCGVDPRTATFVHGHQLGMGFIIIRYIPSLTTTTYYIYNVYDNIYIYISITKSPFSNTKSTFSDTHPIPSSLFHRKTLRRFALNLRC